MDIGRHYLDDVQLQFAKLKAQAEKALAQVDDESFFALLDPEANSVALLVKHLAGNMRSRWTDFLSSDGEKPGRDRDQEFLVAGGEDRASLMAAWEDGWRVTLDAVASLSPKDLQRTVRIRGEAHTVVEAIDRQFAHYAAHVGQIVLLAKHYAGPSWRTLSIPRGQSRAFAGATAAGMRSPAGVAADDAGADPAWQHFLSYLHTAPPLPGPQELLQDYQKALAREGLGRGEIEQRIGTLLRLMRKRSEAWPLLFDRIYASPAPNVSDSPNALLIAAVEGREPGRALEIAVGQGRNAVALAARGWDVTGIDVSEEGLSAARANAERAGVHLTLKREADDGFDFGTGQWDLVAAI